MNYRMKIVLLLTILLYKMRGINIGMFAVFSLRLKCLLYHVANDPKN